jgi:hypothetical protein
MANEPDAGACGSHTRSTEELIFEHASLAYG